MSKIYTDRSDIVEGQVIRVYRTATRDRLALKQNGKLIGFVRKDQVLPIKEQFTDSEYSVSVRLPRPYPG